ncbi:MAG: DivIVA domain-containing protein [Actinomycetota bacterium]|jgi:DivIVA domain-containing protein
MSDLDLPLLPSAEQIRRRKFATVKRGYDPDQVHEYLNQVAIQVETLETDLRDERMGASSRAGEAVAAAPPKAAAPAPPAAAASTEAAYEQLSKRFATVLKAADAESQALIDKARAESTKLLEDARIEADKIRVDAQANAEEARTKSAAELERAREEADRVLGGLEARREAMLTQMHDMQSRLLNVAAELEVPDEGPAAPGAHAATPAQATPASGPKPEPPVAVTPPPPKAPPTQAPGPTQSPVPAQAPVAEGTPGPIGKATEDDEDLVDPRYEDLWASTEARSVDIPDLSALDIDFDDERE